MTDLDQNRLVAKEVGLGAIREILLPDDFIQGDICPMKEVQSDDVIFSYIAPDVSGLAPARAEDAESELAQKDDTVGSGRASLIDWAIKDHYSASDVSRYREYLRLAALAADGSFPLTVTSMTEDFASQVARDTRLRRRKLDNRLEWLAIEGAWTSTIDYNDGKISFSVDYQRPDEQQGGTADVLIGGDDSGTWQGTGNYWTETDSDPISNLNDLNDYMYDTHGLRLDHGYASPRALRNILNSDKFAARSGLAAAGGPSGASIDPNYVIENWGWQAAQAVVERATGITLLPYEGIYRTRDLGSTTTVVNRFADERDILLLPPDNIINEISELGFGKMLTSPHAEGNWTSGYYEWEKDTGPDPWGHDMGTGIKAFPVYPHLEFSAVMRVLQT